MPRPTIIVLSCFLAESGKESQVIGNGTIGFVASLGVVATASRRGCERDLEGAIRWQNAPAPA